MITATTGEGSHVYEVDEGWGALPPGVAFGYTHAVEVDAADNVYVHNRSRDAVAIFDREGRFLGSWGEAFAAGAHGMHLQHEGGREYLYFADPVRHLVAKADLSGHVLWQLGVPDLPDVYPTADRYRPTGVAVAPCGDVYVCDGYGQHWIHRYSADGRRLQSWGGPKELDCPHGIWVDARGPAPVVLVADRGHRHLVGFSAEGEVRFVSGEGVRQPCGFCPDGPDLVVPDLHGRVTVLGPDLAPVAQLGDEPGVWERQGWPDLPPEQRHSGRFVSPHDAAVDSHGDMYVVEWIADGRLTKLHRLAG